MDMEWVVGYLTEARQLAIAAQGISNRSAPDPSAREEFTRRLAHIRTVVHHVLPGEAKAIASTNTGGFYWQFIIPALDRAIYAATEGQEVMRRLGPAPGPQLSADQFHPTVWDAAKSLWRSEHRRQAVGAAAVAVNAALQQRLSRRDISNADLVRQAFSLDPPAPNKSRLRLHPDDGSETYKSIQGGAVEFGAGCFRALRNPIAHDPMEELGDQEALELLAAFSILARWIDAGTLEVAPA